MAAEAVPLHLEGPARSAQRKRTGRGQHRLDRRTTTGRHPTGSGRDLQLVGEGLSNDEIGERLYVSPATVRTHVGRAMTKLAARDRAQLVVFAYQSGLVG